MMTVKRYMSRITVSEIYDQFLIGGYQDLKIPAFVEDELEQHLIEAVAYNVPMMPVVVIRQNDTDLKVITMHHIVYGKERIEQILYLIHKYENKDAKIKGDVPNLMKDFQEHFWHYEMVVHYIEPGLSDAELEQFLNLYQSHHLCADCFASVVKDLSVRQRVCPSCQAL